MVWWHWWWWWQIDNGVDDSNDNLLALWPEQGSVLISWARPVQAFLMTGDTFEYKKLRYWPFQMLSSRTVQWERKKEPIVGKRSARLKLDLDNVTRVTRVTGVTVWQGDLGWVQDVGLFGGMLVFFTNNPLHWMIRIGNKFSSGSKSQKCTFVVTVAVVQCKHHLWTPWAELIIKSCECDVHGSFPLLLFVKL